MNTPMQTKQELATKAKDLLETNPDESVKIYHEIYNQTPELFNEWDAFSVMKAMRKSTAYDIDIVWATELANKFRVENVHNLFGWLVFDKCIKGKKESRDIIHWEDTIRNMANLTLQKNLKENDSYPCPKTISILKLCGAHSKNLFNAQKIDELLSLLDFNLLSHKPTSIATQVRGEVELSSDFEKYFSLKTKALLKLNKFAECKDLCNIALQSLNEFHYDNDLWFKMRIAISEEGLGNTEKSEELFKELLNGKKGSGKWFLYRDLAEIYFEKKDYNRAWKYAIEATFYGNEPHYMIGLYLLQTRILVRLNRREEARILAELIASILNEQQWKSKEEYVKLFRYFEIDRGPVKPMKELMTVLNDFWRKEKYQGKIRLSGKIISILSNGKKGRMKGDDGKMYGFSKRDFEKHQKTIENLKDAVVEFYAMKDFEGKDVAESIAVKSFPKMKETMPIVSNLEGKIIEIRNDNERGKDGFLKSGDKKYYFSVNKNYPMISKIMVGVGVIFERITSKDKERVRIIKITNT